MSAEYLILVAGGSGSRMNSSLPKQFLQLNGTEIITHVIKRFRSYRNDLPIVIAVHKDHLDLMKNIIEANKFLHVQICEGGDTRFQSVKNALSKIGSVTGIVGIHDAARPLVSLQTIKNCFETAALKGNAIPAIASGESLRYIDDEGSKAVPRVNYRIIQTPQCFNILQLQKAFEVNYSDNFTDDATVFEAAGHSIELVEGNPENIKITLPKDLITAKALLDAEQR